MDVATCPAISHDSAVEVSALDIDDWLVLNGVCDLSGRRSLIGNERVPRVRSRPRTREVGRGCSSITGMYAEILGC